MELNKTMNIIAFICIIIGVAFLGLILFGFCSTRKPNKSEFAPVRFLKKNWETVLWASFVAACTLFLGFLGVPGIANWISKSVSSGALSEVMRPLANGSFEVSLRQRFPDQSFDTVKQPNHNCVTMTFETPDRRVFSVEAEAVQIKNRLGTRLKGTLTHDRPWHFWPWYRKYYVLTLE